MTEPVTKGTSVKQRRPKDIAFKRKSVVWTRAENTKGNKRMNKKHIFFYNFFRPLIILFLKFKFGYQFEKAKDLPDNYIVLSNHVTDYDPLFVGASFPRQMYFVASEHIARWKKLYAFLKFTFEPIIRYKGAVGSAAVMEALRKVRKGANVCIFAEGVRTWDGITCPILPSTGKMVKAAGCGLVTYKIVGGYFVSPNWSTKNTRRGYVHGAPVNVYTKEQLAEMTVDEVNCAINRDLYEDAYERQLADPKKYKGKLLAERMENLLFICPHCKEIDTMQSKDDTVSCKSCGFSFRYDEYGMLKNAPFETVRELAAWQKEQVANAAMERVTYTSHSATLSTIVGHEETLVDEGPLSFSSSSLKCGNTEVLLEDIWDLANHGRNAIVFTANKNYYELKPAKDTNTIKFMFLYQQYKKN